MSKVILSPSVLNSKLSITLDPIKHASHLPIFDGCRDQLKNFTDMVDVMVPILHDYDTSSQIIVSNIIKSRIVGKAKQILDSSPHITKWEEIKKILYANFSDQRNSSQLLNELRSTEFRGSIIDYINLIQKRLTNLNLKVEQEQKFNFVKIIQDNHTIALEVLNNNMPEPIRTILFCRNPTSIENVIFILSETGHLYQKKEKDHNQLIQLIKRVSPLLQNDNYQIVIKADKVPLGEHAGRFNAPTVDEVAVIMVGDPVDKRSIKITRRDNTVSTISDLHRSYDALQYPLIFWQGQDEYHLNIKQYDPNTGDYRNNKVTTHTE
ncbi:unnamed protein product [Hermetia illucens]|uniref:Uncharacterized protein n=1 Tax=Hermetia illucens TaxID=343691 RepID=A0A7R8Z0R5_HERIL|nr:unnamed protein product [Hermetia illucens]